MTSQKLRDAAKVLREKAEAATPGPWEATDNFGHDAGRAYVIPSDPEIPTYVSAGGSPDEDRDADYIAAVHPLVGLALADWLDIGATNAEKNGWQPGYLEALEHTPALRIADLILGGAA